jgi:hypothetical protein
MTSKNESIGLRDNDTEEDIKCARATVNELLKDLDLMTNLDSDVIVVPGQKYAVVSFIGPTMTAKTEMNGVRLMGVFETTDEAMAFIDRFGPEEKMYDSGIVELYEYVPSYPMDEKVDANQYLHKIVFNYRDKFYMDRELYTIRKNKLINNKNRYKEEDLPDEELEKLFEKSGIVENEVSKLDPIQNSEKDEKPRNKTHERLLEKLKNRKNNSTKTENTKNISELILEPSKLKCSMYNYAAITFVSDPYNNAPNSRTAMKIRGFFEDEEACRAHIEKLMEFDDMFDIFLVKMYVWLPSNPDVEKIPKKFRDDKLNMLYEEREKQKTKVQQYTNKRKEAEPLNKLEEQNIRENENEKKIDFDLMKIREKEEEFTKDNNASGKFAGQL